ncbi:hypothetical protein SAMN04487894_109159 [Niabella drilacis]|uniref:Uncharacterized protein n=1 Tax=Niabella drilacis (strain DSM 25811 / CCM 8410 / CCUG 62505 / LMG 26954 / E90) TaxID=1285928 RepID=A0A1G6V180_NIADE|nr:hypothetical protein SAMN04487894_109159 [Niabella drilacis]
MIQPGKKASLMMILDGDFGIDRPYDKSDVKTGGELIMNRDHFY